MFQYDYSLLGQAGMAGRKFQRPPIMRVRAAAPIGSGAAAPIEADTAAGALEITPESLAAYQKLDGPAQLEFEIRAMSPEDRALAGQKLDGLIREGRLCGCDFKIMSKPVLVLDKTIKYTHKH